MNLFEVYRYQLWIFFQATAGKGEDWWVGMSRSLGIFTKGKRTGVSSQFLQNLHRILSLCLDGLKTYYCPGQLWWIYTSWRWEKQQFRIELRRYRLDRQCSNAQWFGLICWTRVLSSAEEKKKKKKKSKKKKSKKHSEDSDPESDSDGELHHSCFILISKQA